MLTLALTRSHLAMKTVRREFRNEEVRIDGQHFVRCHFVNCRIIFSGTNPPSLENNSFDGCQFVLDGPAQVTIESLRLLYHGGLKPVVEDWLSQVTGLPNK